MQRKSLGGVFSLSSQAPACLNPPVSALVNTELRKTGRRSLQAGTGLLWRHWEPGTQAWSRGPRRAGATLRGAGSRWRRERTPRAQTESCAGKAESLKWGHEETQAARSRRGRALRGLGPWKEGECHERPRSPLWGAGRGTCRALQGMGPQSGDPNDYAQKGHFPVPKAPRL